MKKKTLSVVVLAKNEEAMISDCLASVKFADEIILVDNNSTDTTVSLALALGAKIIKTNADSFAMRREIGQQKASCSYILYIDADERVSKELAQEIQDFLSEDLEIDAGILKRENYYLGNNRWPFPEYFARLFKSSSLKGWKGDLHETASYSGKEKKFRSPILHFTHRDFKSMVEKTNEWSEIEAQLRFKSSHPRMSWWRFPRVMLGAFYNSFIKQQGYRSGKVGFLESIYQAFSIFITYAKLWELQQKKAKTPLDTH